MVDKSGKKKTEAKALSMSAIEQTTNLSHLLHLRALLIFCNHSQNGQYLTHMGMAIIQLLFDYNMENFLVQVPYLLWMLSSSIKSVTYSHCCTNNCFRKTTVHFWNSNKNPLNAKYWKVRIFFTLGFLYAFYLIISHRKVKRILSSQSKYPIIISWQ